MKYRKETLVNYFPPFEIFKELYTEYIDKTKESKIPKNVKKYNKKSWLV
jgi:hypothetical protein